ncbi:MAG: hypothetical protein MUF64_01765 [Polyangiaceae bacterium]|jgi:hypothetical protein|nr:hypothetical protein [Polyangiaceae bacterium]
MRAGFWIGLVALVGAVGCKKPETYTTTAELLRVHPLGRDPRAPVMLDVELRYSDCPGDIRRFVRGDKEFAACGLGLKAGEKVPIDVKVRFDQERGVFRSELTRIGPCALRMDPKDEANFERIEQCSDVRASGLVVGVRCSRQRDDALIKKCPWLRRE